MPLTDQTYKQFALQHYDNPSCSSLSEFEEDLARVRYVKRLCHKYKQTGVLKDRMILNHLVILHNLFGTAMIPMLFLKIEDVHWPVMAPFLKALDLLPHYINELQPALNTDRIQHNPVVVNAIRQLLEK